jgi:Carboxypeptidase regulatory-like domain
MRPSVAQARRFRTVLFLLALAAALILQPCARAQQTSGILRGSVTDPSGAAVQGAAVQVTSADGHVTTAMTTRLGAYEIRNLAPGTYDVQVAAQGFALFESKDVQVKAAQAQTVDASLKIKEQEEKVVVQAENSTALDVNPENNAGAIVLKEDDLKALSDDPDELQNDLEALAGPSAGPSGGQMYIDGFTAGQLPPKSSIREIRINQNPFSSEYDKLGYGRIEIFTKPGTDKWHGNIDVQGNDSSFNSSDPFAVSPVTHESDEPPYYSTLFNGNIGGPLSKKASISLSGQYRDINDVGVVDAVVLDPSFQPTPFISSVPEPRTRINMSPRLDYQLTPNNTLSVRYQYYRDNEDNQGLAGFALPSQAFNSLTTEDTVQISDTQVIGMNMVNETHFQYLRDASSQMPQNGLPTVTVLGSFTGGGNNEQSISDLANHYELQNYTQWVHGKQTVKFGVRLREIVDTETIDSGFNGNYTFSSIAAYQTTEQGLAQGLPFSAIQAEGGGASQFSVTLGIPRVHVAMFDSGWYVQDDWRVRPNLTLSGGLRLEQQNDIPDHFDWAPRAAIAWGIGRSKGTPKTVLRAGSGVFYDRFTENLVLQSELLDGAVQHQSVVTSPCFFSPTAVLTSIPSCVGAEPQTVLPTTYRVATRLHAPGTLQSAVTVEHQVNKSMNISLSYLNSRGFDQLLSNNVNTPLPGTYPLSPVYPLGTPGNVYEFESEAIYRQNQLISQVNYRWKSWISLRGYYALNSAKSDTSGPTSFPSNPYNILEDYGRTAFDIRHRVFVGGSVNLPHGFALYPFMLVNSGIPYSITISKDLIGSSQFNQRPAYASSLSNPADVVVTPIGSFDTVPQAGETIVPVDSLTGPTHFALNLRVSKTWGFGGEKPQNAGGNQPGGGRGGPGGGPGGFGGGGPGGGAGGGGRGGPGGGFGGPGGGGGGASGRRYSLTLSVNARNIFNYENLATPTAVLNPPNSVGGVASESPFFGRSNGLFGQAFSSNSASRLIYLQLGFSF